MPNRRRRIGQLHVATLAAALWCACPALADPPRASSLPQPPDLPAKPVTDTYFGTAVTDRFRYVEALPPEVIEWMKRQGAYTRAVFASIGPRAAYEKRLGELGGAFGAVAGVQAAGPYLFYRERAPGRDQFDLVYRDVAGVRHVLVDAARLIEQAGGPVAIDHFTASPDGAKVAVAIAESGSESSRLSVIDTATGKTVAGPIWQGAFGSEAWTDDGAGLFVGRLREPFAGMKPGEAYLNSETVWWDLRSPPKPVAGVRYRLGPNTDPVRFPFVLPIHGTDQALLLVVNGVQSELELWIAPLADARAGAAKWNKIASTEDAVTGFDVSPQRIYFLTHKDAPNFKVTSAALGGTAADAAVEIPERPDRFIEHIGWAKDGLYAVGRDRLQGILLRRAGDTTTQIPVPEGATVDELSTNWDAPGAYVSVNGFTVPWTTYAYDPAAGRLVDRRLETRPALDLTRFTAVSTDAVAKDGVKVPLSILVPAGPRKPRPFLLDAYGSYGISNLPFFSPRQLVFAESGAGFAVCSVRGGGELGEKWRLAGKEATKPNTWRDAIACAETLIREGYTTPALLSITGTSAGGIMVGRAATERPELFAGAISRVGDSNALRSETMPGGPANIPEFGTVANEPGFHALYEMDAYQHVRDGVAYPPFLLTTGLTDPRVSPWIPAKMAARLMEASTSPVLLRVEEQAGHGIGTTRSTRDAEEADIAAFVFWRAGVPEWQPK